MRAKEQPIIIVRRKKAAHGHHGGAWKVAYADFVTAMMAFFLVMWLASQDSRIRDAVAGYFQEPGLLPYQQSNSIIASGNGGIDSAGMPVINRKFNGQLEAEQKALIKAAGHIHDHLSELRGFATLRNQVEFSVTLEGLRIELVDKNGSSFFDSGSSKLALDAEKILAIIGAEVGQLDNDVVVEGHTDSLKYSAHGEQYTNWELSSDRANAARRILLGSGLRQNQISAVRGFADTDLRVPDNPMDPRNRRVSIVVRSQSAVESERSARARQTSPESIAAARTGFVSRPANALPRMSAAPGAAPAEAAAPPTIPAATPDHSSPSR
ncbi:MAG: flagellar motor protein MotB [Acidobacteriota bacterium]